MPSYRKLLQQAIKKCELSGVSADAPQLLLTETCGLSNTDLYVKYDEDVNPEFIEQFNNGVERLCNGEPLQYVLGYWWFCGYKMVVNEGALIPRPETEELVGNVLADSDYYFADLETIEIADVGTGSGAIAIALKNEEQKFHMTATDISFEALDVAKENASINNCEIDFLQGDMLQPLIDKGIKLDILVSNPPYIPAHQQMEKAVVDFEPHVALFGGDDGLFFYRKIFEKAYEVVKEHSFMAFEIGYDEKEAITKLVEQYFPNDKYEVLKDINGKDRMLFVYHNLD